MEDAVERLADVCVLRFFSTPHTQFRTEIEILSALPLVSIHFPTERLDRERDLDFHRVVAGRHDAKRIRTPVTREVCCGAGSELERGRGSCEHFRSRGYPEGCWHLRQRVDAARVRTTRLAGGGFSRGATRVRAAAPN